MLFELSYSGSTLWLIYEVFYRWLGLTFIGDAFCFRRLRNYIHGEQMTTSLRTGNITSFFFLAGSF